MRPANRPIIYHESRKPIVVQMSEELIKNLDKKCLELNLSRTVLINNILVKYINKYSIEQLR